MSLEMMLLIAAFLVLPLVQQLVRAERLRQEERQSQVQNPVQAEGRPASANRLPMPELPPALSVDETIPANAMAAPPLRVTKNIARPASAAIRRSAPWGTLAVGLRDPHNLRRAVILRTVIGPCRAANPHGSSDGGGH
jgi:hypothetical protein